MDNGTEVLIWGEETVPRGAGFIIDSGAPGCSIPKRAWDQLLKSLPVINHIEGEVECSAMEASKGSIDFSFGSTTIKVPFREFFWRTSSGRCYLAAKRGARMCIPYLLIRPRCTDIRLAFILGASFLRSAYLAIDYGNHTAYLAQNADCGSEIVTIGNSPNTISNISSLVGKCTPRE